VIYEDVFETHSDKVLNYLLIPDKRLMYYMLVIKGLPILEFFLSDYNLIQLCVLRDNFIWRNFTHANSFLGGFYAHKSTILLITAQISR